MMKLIGDLPHNARYSLAFEPLWAVFNGMIFFYAPLYMREIGLSEIEMGIINTVNLMSMLICQFMAAPITNRLGRKRTTLIADIAAWTIPMLLWALAQNFWFFVAAYAINACGKIAGTAWFCLVSEDAPKEKTPKVFMILYTLILTSGMFTPVTGLLIARFGTIPALRSLYFFGMISMTAMFFLRNKFVVETETGSALMRQNSGAAFWGSLKHYIGTVAEYRGQKFFRLYTVLYILGGMVVAFNFYQVLYLTEAMGFSKQAVSYIPLVSAAANILVYLTVLPRLGDLLRDERALVLFSASAALGAILFLCVPIGNIFILLASTMILNVSFTLIQSYRDAGFINRAGINDKADALSAVQTLNIVACIPIAFIAGYLYSVRPVLPFFLILTAYVVMLSVSLAMVSILITKGSHTKHQ